MSSLAAEVRKSWMVPNDPRWYEPQISPMETGSVIQARVERWMGWGGCCWVALSDGRKVIVKPVRCCSIEPYWITLSYITFMTHLSVSILFYKYNIWLETEMRVMVGNSNTVFRIQILSEPSPKPQHSAVRNINRAEPHGNSIILSVHRTPTVKTTVSKIRHQHTTTRNNFKTHNNSVSQWFIMPLLWDRLLADLINLNSAVLYGHCFLNCHLDG